MHSYLTAHCSLQRQVAEIAALPFTGRFPFLASPLRCRLANASGRIEFISVLFMDWSFASGCSPPRLSTTQLPSATDRPVFLSDRDFHPTVGAYSQAHVSRHFVPGYFRLVPPGQNTLFRCRIFLKLALMGLKPWAVLSSLSAGEPAACSGYRGSLHPDGPETLGICLPFGKL
jgi:hypothetical protein